MKKILSLVAIAALLCSCDNTPKFHVTGCIEGAADSMLYLDALSLDGTRAVDSVRIAKDGSFNLKYTAPTDAPDFYALRLGSQRITISVDSTETITIKANLATIASEYTVEGSENSTKIKEISLLQQAFQKQIVDIESNKSLYPGDIIDSVNNVIREYKENIKNNYIFTDPAQAYAYYAVCQSVTDLRGTFYLFDPVNNREDVKCYAAVATAWDAFYPDAPRTQQICNAAIQGLGNTMPTAPSIPAEKIDSSKIKETGIIDVNLPDADSKFHSLTALKGKVVLLDFTVYGAAESSQRVRLLRTLYDKYAAQGFEIYQVSLDDDIHYWKSNVEHLPWTCVHETDGSATRIYGVQNVPTFFLINRDNEVVVRNDFLEGSLESNIQKLL